jgi:hypothetical protein
MAGRERAITTYRGTWSEIETHKTEIPPDAWLELRVFERQPGTEPGDFGGRSILEAFPHLFGTERGGPDDISDRAACV